MKMSLLATAEYYTRTVITTKEKLNKAKLMEKENTSKELYNTKVSLWTTNNTEQGRKEALTIFLTDSLEMAIKNQDS